MNELACLNSKQYINIKKMDFTVVGISYKKTFIETRELLFIEEQDYSPLLKRIYHRFQIKEVVILSTCNRLEIYYINNQNFQPHD